MKNKNKVSKKNQQLISDIKIMVNQVAMSGDQFKGWRESWMEVVAALEQGYSYESTYGLWPGPIDQA